MSDLTPSPAMVEETTPPFSIMASPVLVTEWVISATQRYLSDPKNAQDAAAFAEAFMESLDADEDLNEIPASVPLYRVKGEQ